MNKKDYTNSVSQQVRDLKNLALFQTERCFDLDVLRASLGVETAKNIRRVIITGCGDSYSAAGAMLPGFKLLSGIKKCESPDIMDFCCFYSACKAARGFDMDKVLVVAISFSGSADRVAEALTRAKELGAESILITRTPDSKGGRAAKHILDVATPDGCNTPGLRSYYASLVGLSALAAYIGLCNGTITRERFFEVKEKIAAYTLRFMEEIERIDDQMFREALRMRELKKFEVIADWNEGFSGQFVEQKLIECGGVYCGHTNSEEFAHISFFLRRPEEVGTVVIIHSTDPSLSRMRDTVNGALAQGRPVLIVTDAPPETFSPWRTSGAGKPGDGRRPTAIETVRPFEITQSPTVCRIPTAPEQWMFPLVDFIPGSLLAGYQAAVNERAFFAGRYDFRTQTWSQERRGETHV